ncbi:MAG: hypothetical protein Q8P84_05725 [Deltaproteobacteria bacterium]|nr:hypothetical protein [Deltaproteobacteria bacterium]
MAPLFYTTGNHHLFLILKTAKGHEWIALLGKRKPNFPFWGDRFENATFYNVTQDRLFHAAARELPDLHFEKGPIWKIFGETPLPFSIDLHPNYTRTKRILAMARFRYHLPSLSFQNGAIENDPVVFGHGFSEQGRMTHLGLKNFEVPFQYDLWLESQGLGGFLNWRGNPTRFKPFLQKYLKDAWRWGEGGRFNPENAKVLAVMHIPLKNWRLRREIVVCHTGGGRKWFGLKESFVKMETVHV